MAQMLTGVSSSFLPAELTHKTTSRITVTATALGDVRTGSESHADRVWDPLTGKVSPLESGRVAAQEIFV